MNDEPKDLIAGLFPEGQERWLKIRYNDTKECVKIFAASFNKPVDSAPFHVVAIGVTPEYEPQISALMDVRDEITTLLVGVGNDWQLDRIREILQRKIEELKHRTTYQK